MLHQFRGVDTSLTHVAGQCEHRRLGVPGLGGQGAEELAGPKGGIALSPGSLSLPSLAWRTVQVGIGDRYASVELSPAAMLAANNPP